MNEYQYKHKDWNGLLDEDKAHTYPFILVDVENPVWQAIEDSISEEFGTNFFYKESYLLISGAVNLINEVLNTPPEVQLDTLVFLDKSARPGAFIFRLLWRFLEKDGRIPDSYLCPQTVFINIGSESHLKPKSPASQRLLSHYLDLHDKRVLIVDEYISSGRSVGWTQELLDQVYDVKADSMALFAKTPSWRSWKTKDDDDNEFRDNKLKGVQDGEFDYYMVKNLDKLDESLVDFLYLITSERSKDHCIAFFKEFEFDEFADEDEYDSAVSEKTITFYSNFISDIQSGVILANPRIDIQKVLPTATFNVVSTSISAILDYYYSAESLYSAIKTAGGLLVEPFENVQFIQESVKYRKALKMMVELAAHTIKLGPTISATSDID